MKALILAGGYGTRLSEETQVKPKPMAEIGGRPMLWHIMKIYSHYGVRDFVILLGYKGYVIKEYFLNYFVHQSDVTVDLSDNSVQVHQNASEPWKVTMVDTGLHTMSGGRIARAAAYIGNERFHLTYGDGVADVDLRAVEAFHVSKGLLMTMTSVQPEGRFGAVEVEEDGTVARFSEKPAGDGQWINGGFMVCEPGMLRYLTGDGCSLEKEPLEQLARERQLSSYRHPGFWKCMDTMRDKIALDELWNSERPPWKVWPG